jgi:opacity protein-like surface antigen
MTACMRSMRPSQRCVHTSYRPRQYLSSTKFTWNAIDPSGNTATATFNSRWLTTATGKLGYAWDRVLVYGKGGGAWVGADNPNLTVNGLGTTLTSSTTTNFGWTAGVGVEWAFAGNWSARIEYDFIGLQNQSITVAWLPLEHQ